jgi:hypothetical protein
MSDIEIKKRFIMNRKDIGFFKAILESYEEIAIFSVLDGERGLIEVIYPSNFEDDVTSIMSDMAQYEIFFQEVHDV